MLRSLPFSIFKGLSLEVQLVPQSGGVKRRSPADGQHRLLHWLWEVQGGVPP